MRVAFVYPNPRAPLLEAIATGEAPDTNLLGMNHLRALGFDAFVYESLVRRHRFARGPLHRLTWVARELTLPLELHRADVICTPLATLLPLAARIERGPRVLTISYHLASLYARAGAARRRLVRRVLGSAAHIVCVSTEGRRRLIQLTGLDPRKVSVATLGVDAAFWQPAPPAADGCVLAVGRDLARDYGTFFRAVERLPVQAVVVAKEENLRGLEVPRNVQVHLNIGADEVKALYARAACVVVPIRSEERSEGTENSGTVAYLEACAAARPAIVTERRFLDDYVEAGTTALTVPAEDPSALQHAIQDVLGDPDRAARMGAAARSAVEQRFTTRHFAELLADVIRSL